MEPEKHIERSYYYYRKFDLIDKRKNKANSYYYDLKGILNSYFGQKYNIMEGNNSHYVAHFKNNINFGQRKSCVTKGYIEKIFKLNLSTPSLSDEEMKQAKWDF